MQIFAIKTLSIRNFKPRTSHINLQDKLSMFPFFFLLLSVADDYSLNAVSFFFYDFVVQIERRQAVLPIDWQAQGSESFDKQI